MGDALTVALVGKETAGSRFEALYRSCAQDVYAYVASLLRDRSAAEDITALAFERAFRRRRTFDARRGSERAWLFGIARNAALDGEAVGEEELERLVTDLRAVRPRPSHAFRVALDERVAAGFRRPERRRLRLRGALVPALGVAATALVALVVAGVVSNDGRPARPSTG